jgi:hypothetical protein
VGGSFGTHHFNQFFPILKLKEFYNEQKAEGEAVQNDPFVKSAKALGGPMAAKHVAKNLDTLKAVEGVLASIPVIDRLNPFAMIRSFANGGILGVVTNIASVVTETVSQLFTASAVKVSMDYTYEDGFGASVDVGFGVGAGRVSVVNVGYSEFGGFSASLGATFGKGTGMEIGAAVTYSEQEGFGATASAKGMGFNASVAYTQNSGFSASAALTLGNKNKGLALGFDYNEKDGFSAKAGVAYKGFTAGLNYSKANGVGVYAGRMINDTTSAEIGWDRKNGYQASIGSDNARATYSDKNGLGFKFTKEVLGGEAEFAYTARGGFEASYSKSLGNGFSTSVNYSQKDGFSADLRHKDGNNVSRSMSFGRDGVSSSVQQNNDNDLFIDSMEKLQGINDQTIGANKARIEAKSFKELADGLSKNNPELEKYKDNPEAFNAKLKELSEADNLLDSQGQNYKIDRGGSRDSFLSKAWGEVEDIGRSFVGQTVTDKGYIDSQGKFHVRTCFVAGTKVHTKNGLKNIEDIQVGDVVLSWNETTGEREYKVVTELFLHEVELLFEVKTSKGTTIETTWNHPFWVVDKKAWIEAKDLQAGDTLSLANGSLIEISYIRAYNVVPTKVYNFEVGDNHSYFVGEDGVLVHNYDLQTGRVQKGDTISKIRKELNEKYGTNYTDADIIRMNGILDGNKISVDQIIVSPELFDEFGKGSEKQRAFFLDKSKNIDRENFARTITIGGSINFLGYGAVSGETGTYTELYRRGEFFARQENFGAASSGDISWDPSERNKAKLSLGGKVTYTKGNLEDYKNSSSTGYGISGYGLITIEGKDGKNIGNGFNFPIIPTTGPTVSKPVILGPTEFKLIQNDFDTWYEGDRKLKAKEKNQKVYPSIS